MLSYLTVSLCSCWLILLILIWNSGFRKLELPGYDIALGIATRYTPLVEFDERVQSTTGV